MIHERASGIVSHSITSGKESLGKPLEQEYLARVCIIPVRGLTATGEEERGRSLQEQGGNFVATRALTNERVERALIKHALSKIRYREDTRKVLSIPRKIPRGRHETKREQQQQLPRFLFFRVRFTKIHKQLVT